MSELEAKRLSEEDWRILLRRIKLGKCTPFLGAGACCGTLPLGGEIARELAQEYRYPGEDKGDLARIAQYLAVSHDAMFPKELVLERYVENRGPPEFSDPDEPHAVLADLPLPVYMTTNYDDFMVQALKYHNRNPKQVYCKWNQLLEVGPSPSLDAEFEPRKEEPIVFHLHGHKEECESLVLTEDDYLDFLVNVTRDQDRLPHQIRRAFAGSTLLFIGYSLNDWDFRVLFRGLVRSTEPSLRRLSITVQLLPVPKNAPESVKREMRGYMDKYFDDKHMHVYWGTAREFAAELRERWEKVK